MTKRERMQALLHGKAVDRTPLSFWRHLPEIDERPELLAEAIVRDHLAYDLDFVKMMPSGMYGVEDWGCRVGIRTRTLGSSGLLDGPIHVPNDWRKITQRLPDQGSRRHLSSRCLELVPRPCPRRSFSRPCSAPSQLLPSWPAGICSGASPEL